MSDIVRVTVPHLRLVWGGTLGSAQNEIWTCSLKLVGQPMATGDNVFAPVTDSQGNLLSGILATATAEAAAIADTGGSGGPNLVDALNVNMVPVVKTFHSSLGRSDSSLTWVKLNAFGADDEQMNGATVEAQFNPITGPVGCSLPYSTAVVAEFRSTNRTRGRGSHGRFSYPAGAAMGSNGQLGLVGGGSATELVTPTALLAFLAGLNLMGTGGSTQFVPSIVYTQLPNHTYKRPGTRGATFNTINRCFWSSIPGEVRRRQSKLKQTSTQAPIIYGNPTAPTGA